MARPLVTDALWERIEPLLPPPKRRRRRFPGRKPADRRKVLAGIIFVLRTGIPWEEVPAEMGVCGMTCWNYLRAWQAAGVWQRLHEVLLNELQGAGKIDWEEVADFVGDSYRLVAPQKLLARVNRQASSASRRDDA